MISLPILVLVLTIKGPTFIEAFNIFHQQLDDSLESFEGLDEVVSNLVNVDNTDLIIISDFHLKQQLDLTRNLNMKGIQHRIMSLESLENKMKNKPNESCPFFIQPHHKRRRKRAATEEDEHHNGHDGEDQMLFIPREELYRRESFIPKFQYYPSFVIWTKNYERLFKVFDSTIMVCKQKVDVGIYDSDSRFFFVLHRREKAEDVFGYNDYLYRHPQVALLQKVDTMDYDRVKFKIFGYNFFDEVNGLGKVILNHVWSREDPVSNIKQVFTDIMDMQGLKLRIATNPWSHHVLGDSIPENDPEYSESNKFKNYWGYEIEMLKNMASTLNFTYSIENPPDGKWGHVEPDGRWNGLVYHVSQDFVDLIICDVFIVYGRQQVFDGTISFDVDYMVFSAPMPSLLPKYLALVYPFQLLIWILLGVSIILFSFLFYIIARVEGAITQWKFREWHTLANASWYSYGTFMGEAITRDTKSERGRALRVVIAIWILYCLIMSSTYAGSLKAYLTTPAYSSPIDTLQQVIESQLPWGMVLYGEEEEEMMANSEDPIIKTIWNDKIEAEYSPVPQIRPVYEGKKVFIDWKSGLEPAIFARYSTPAGDPLIHVASNPVFMPNYPGWAFFKFNPWRKRFNQVIRRMLEAGLVEHYKYYTWLRMKREYLQSDEEKLVHVERPLASGLTMDDLQGLFYLAGLMLALAFIIFFVENAFSYSRQRSLPNSATKIIHVGNM